jgi:hypothetical protein
MLDAGKSPSLAFAARILRSRSACSLLWQAPQAAMSMG